MWSRNSAHVAGSYSRVSGRGTPSPMCWILSSPASSSRAFLGSLALMVESTHAPPVTSPPNRAIASRTGSDCFSKDCCATLIRSARLAAGCGDTGCFNSRMTSRSVESGRDSARSRNFGDNLWSTKISPFQACHKADTVVSEVTTQAKENDFMGKCRPELRATHQRFGLGKSGRTPIHIR